jgi:hypothetical protein
MKADYLLDNWDLHHLLRGGTQETLNHNFVKATRSDLQALRNFVTKSRKDRRALLRSGNWNNVSNYPEFSKMLPPCPFCDWRMPPTIKHVNAFRNDEPGVREYTFVRCEECNFTLIGGLLGTESVAWFRWEKAFEIMRAARGDIAPNDLFYIHKDLVIDGGSKEEYEYVTPTDRHKGEGRGNRVNKERGIIVFGETDFHDFLQDQVLFISPYKYFRFGYNTLLNHRAEWDVEHYLLPRIKYLEEHPDEWEKLKAANRR